MSLATVYNHDELGHVTIVTYGRRWFRKVYWVRCLGCDLKIGPFLTRTHAENHSKVLWGAHANTT